eukprot:scaffold7219_cov540-Prasinococcus_capsulatus_cf.AAC.2
MPSAPDFSDDDVRGSAVLRKVPQIVILLRHPVPQLQARARSRAFASTLSCWFQSRSSQSPPEGVLAP